MKRRRIAIIGAGFSGVAVAANLLRFGREAPDVVLIERRPHFGPGLAYQTTEKAHLLNVRARNMSALAAEPDHFVRWLARRRQRDAAVQYMPRTIYGRYVEDVLRRARRGVFDTGLKRVRGDVVGCTRIDTRWRLTLADDESVDADAVVLALGNAPSETPAVFTRAGIELLEPWDVHALRRIPEGDVLLLGAGLTMVDAALTLSKLKRDGIFYALSRRGLTPRAHLSSPALPAPNEFDPPLVLSAALHAFRASVREAAARGEPWQHAIDRLRARTPDLWCRLPIEAQQRFLRHLRVWWDVHRHRMAPEVAAKIERLRKRGRLRVLAGEIVSAEAHAKHLTVQHRQRGSFVRHRLHVAAIVNCTGASLDPARTTEPLVQRLIEDGLARAHANGLGFDVDQEGRLLSREGTPSDGLFALGPITQGAFWECTAAPEIRVRAAALAAMLAQR